MPTAGLPTLPQNLVYAAQMLTQYLYQATNHDFNEKSVKLGPYNKDLNTDQPGFPGPVRVIINRYRDLSKGLYTGVG